MSMIWLKGSPPYLDIEERANQMKLPPEIRRLYMIGCCAMNPMVVLSDSCSVFLPIDSVSTCFCGKAKERGTVKHEYIYDGPVWRTPVFLDKRVVVAGRWIGGGWRCRKRMMMKHTGKVD